MTERMDVNQYKQAAKKATRTRLEDRFLEALQVYAADIPLPEREYRFHPARKWRFDFAWPQIKLAVEIHGGSWTGGRHNRGDGQAKDFEKLNAAQVLGWVVLQFGTDQMKDAAGCAVATVDAMCDRKIGV